MENKIRFKAKTAAENQKEQELFEETKALVLKAIESHGSFLTINVINSIVSVSVLFKLKISLILHNLNVDIINFIGKKRCSSSIR